MVYFIFIKELFFRLIKTGYSLIDFKVSFPMQSSEFTKLLNLGSNSKKKKSAIFLFPPKNLLLIEKKYFKNG